MLEYAQQGKLVDLKSFMSEEYLQGQYPQSFFNLATYQDQVFGAWFSAGLKSLVWYPKPEFEARGYEAPETWEELIALTDQIVVEGGTPWCIGIDDSDALRLDRHRLGGGHPAAHRPTRDLRRLGSP